MCLDRRFNGDIIPHVIGYKDFVVGQQRGKYVLRPTYQRDAMVYNNIKSLYTKPPGLRAIPTWFSGVDYEAGFHAYASPTADMSESYIRCVVNMYNVRTLGIQEGEIVLVADQFSFRDTTAWHMRQLADNRLHMYGVGPNHKFDPAKFESDMGLVLCEYPVSII